MLFNCSPALASRVRREINRRPAWYVSAALAVIFFFYLSHVTEPDERSWHPTSSRLPPPVRPQFKPGVAKPPGEPYTLTMVLAKLRSDDMSWLYRHFPDANTTVYVVDDEPGQLKIPKNKGREAMAYLTYMIDHYDALPDISLFFHPHQFAWHNSDLHGQNILDMLETLNPAHIARVGYMPLRCQHDPGCPRWLHLDLPEHQLDSFLRMEEKYFTSKVWWQLHPGTPRPDSISEPCCSQFALWRDRIRAQPVSEYVRYRDWLLNTPLDDEISGRWMEYSWQYLFTGQAEYCPSQSVCFCDGYGICFGGDAQVQLYLDKLKEMRNMSDQADALDVVGGNTEKTSRLRSEANELNAWLDATRTRATERGKDPINRALDCGRLWKEGDGF